MAEVHAPYSISSQFLPQFRSGPSSYGPATAVDLDSDMMQSLSQALATSTVPFDAGGKPSNITPEKFQLRMEVQSLNQSLANTRLEAQQAIVSTQESARMALAHQLNADREVCRVESQDAAHRAAAEVRASLSDEVAEEAERVNAINKNALQNASHRLQSESQEIENLRTEYQGGQVHSSLILQSEVNAVQNNADRALNDQQNSCVNASRLYQQSEQAQMGKLRSEHQEHLTSFQQKGQLLTQA